MSEQRLNHWRLTLPLALPALAGLAYLAFFGAPARLIAVNAGALAVAIAWVLWGGLPGVRKGRRVAAATALLLLFLPPLLPHDVDGVARWLPLGRGLMLHSGTLLVPPIAVVAACEPRLGPLLLAIAAVALALQPDAGVLAGLAAASAVLAGLHRSWPFALVAGGSLTAAISTFGAGNLAPQRYTEGVLPHVADHSPIGAAALGLLLFGAPLWWLAIRPAASREQSQALAALLTGLGVMAIIGPFPYPLIGYGASAILGFGLALGVTASGVSVNTRTRFHASA